MRTNSTLLALLLGAALALALPACGGDDDKSETDTSATSDSTGGSDALADATGDTGGTQDTGGSKDTGGTQDTGGSKDTGGTQDTATVAPTCGEALLCGLSCPTGDKGCQDACAKDLAAGDVTKLGAAGTCHVDLCGAVTEGAIAELNCDFAECYDKIDACAGFGAGDADCMATFTCVGACDNGDAACKLACYIGADAGATAAAKALRICADAKCDAKADVGTRAACIANNCAAELGTCTDGKAYDCIGSSYCTAHCPESLPNKPNTCASHCAALATEAARKAATDLSTCREQCVKAINPVGCWAEKCSTELGACFGAGGTETCQDIDNCVSENCDGVGGGYGCIKTCLDKGKAGSKDAFLQYEGCVAKNMDTKEAKIAGCEFPYDQATCLPVIKGQFCGNQSQNCFTDK